ncbi:protein of unknown function (LRR and Heterokaryon incompatibility protein HET domain) [endosymbiont DhMRE of Dentiscutata heterogama]|uniref:HET domain-containing protein n=1 Tax=endosymbiont DhMRE of Dentiscutata heterogama TaxID=1609546 RepID=UPI0006361437|nr:HET domain-containing protein [endosymbiont DhMRE of Dentiscutata heterogama]CFW92725.1 protein of unknown function (LRR and Heterokaryon incompatibility protein HET domain) [endosymbiont DhMRE of Dentiscutata heterogama]
MVNAQIWLESQRKYDTKEKREQVTELDISNKNLEGELDLSDFINLEVLICNSNNLTSLNISKQTKLESLTISKNSFPSQNPTWLSHLANLKELYLRQNNFNGSLEFIQNMTNLEVLDIGNTNIEYDLKYLPPNLKWVNRDEKVEEELIVCGNNLSVWRESHSELVEKKAISNVSKDSLEIVTTTPEYLKSELNKETFPALTDLNYSIFTFRDPRPFSWEKSSEIQPTTAEQLPLRLYNLKEKKVEETKNRSDLQDYAILSYVWGTDWENKSELTVLKSDGQSYQVKLTKLGRKAAQKATQTLGLINQNQASLHHIWIDNYCINQGDSQEKGQEVKKQKIYYNNSTVTLIAVNAKIDAKVDKENKFQFAKHIISKIVNSSWFTRSWTFQEGLLSKQTIFMFDDGLVDGRILANIWGGTQQKSSWDNSWIQLNNKIFVTPLGWGHDVQREKNISLRLSQALDAIKHRKQTVALDGIYSILGLLPYGDKIRVKYKEMDHKYAEEELEEALLDMMKVAIQEGFPNEPLIWIGERRNEPELWWIPRIQTDGTTSVEGCGGVAAQFEDLKITPQGLEFTGKREKWDWNKQYITLTADYKKTVKSDKKFYILVPTEENKHLPIKITYSDNPITTFRDESKMFIDMVNKKLIEGETAIQEYKAQIEIPPKTGQN